MKQSTTDTATLNRGTRSKGLRLGTSRQTGATLVEILVTMLITAFALLGIAGMQLNAIRNSQSSKYREVAIGLAQNMAERIRANTLALSETDDASAYRADNGYAASTTSPADPACGQTNSTTVCTPAQSAQRDLREWRKALSVELPGGRGAIQTVNNGATTSPIVSPTVRRIVVMWSEKAKDSDDNLSSAPTDSNCPGTAVAGVRCAVMVVQP